LNKTWQIAAIIIVGVLTIGGVSYDSYYMWQRSAGNISQNTNQSPFEGVSVSPSPSASASPSALPFCKNITGLSDYQFCSGAGKTEGDLIASDLITGPGSIKIGHVVSYSLSPNKEWLFVSRYTDVFAKTGGAPSEGALTMVDIANTKTYELFSQIYFPAYTDKSWSPDGRGIVFTADKQVMPNILGNPDGAYAVVYCTTSCRVLAEDAGPLGIGADPAYFVNGNVHYTKMGDGNGEAIEIPFK